MTIAKTTLAQLNDVTPGLDASLSLSGQVGYHIVGTFVGTITFEAWLEGAGVGNATPIQATNLGTAAAASTATAPGLYRIAASPQIRIRARMSAYTSGSADVYPAVSLG